MKNTPPNFRDDSAALSLWHPTAAGGKPIHARTKRVPDNHRCRTAAGAPGRIVTDYEIVDAGNNKVHTLDTGTQAEVELEVGYTQADLDRAGNKDKLVLAYWDEASGAWMSFTFAGHGFQVVEDPQKYPRCLGYGHVDKNVPFDPPTGWLP